MTPTTILDQWGKPIERSVLADTQSGTIPWLGRYVAGHPARRLTLEKVNGIFSEAEFGFLIRQHELFRDMEERSPHIAAEMGKRKRALIRLDWTVEPPRNANAQEKKLAAAALDMLQDMPHFERLLWDMLDAIGNGFSAIELEWQRLGNTWIVGQHHWRPQYWFQLDQATRMQIHLRDGSPDGAPLLPFGWILHRHQAVSGYTARQGLMRQLVWPFLLEQYATWDLAEYLDIYGMPISIGKYPNNATDKERAALFKAVSDIRHNAAAIVPTTMEMEFQDAIRASGKNPFLEAVDWCERAQSKLILGQTMSAEAKASGMGSGNAQLHGEVRDDIRDADARTLEGTITEQLVYPLLALNFGLDDIRRCPRLVLDTSNAEDLQVLSSAFPKLVSVGMKIPLSFAHAKLRIPQPVGDEPVLKLDMQDVQPLREVKSIAATSAQLPAAHLPAVSGPASHADPASTAIDRALAMLASELPAQGRALARGALDAVAKAGDFKSALAALSAAHIKTDDALLIEVIARAMFVCELVGIEAVRQELKRGGHD